MSEIKDGGSAFPLSEQRSQSGDITSYAEFGMTLRDYFAAKMLAQWDRGMVVCDCPELYDRFADHCYRMADALLRARSQP